MSDLISDRNAYFRCEKGCGVFPRKDATAHNNDTGHRLGECPAPACVRCGHSEALHRVGGCQSKVTWSGAASGVGPCTCQEFGAYRGSSAEPAPPTPTPNLGSPSSSLGVPVQEEATPTDETQIAETLFAARGAEGAAEDAAIEALFRACGLNYDDVDSWPLSDVTFDPYDSSFEFVGVHDGWAPTAEHLAACWALGFARCWIRYANGTERHAAYNWPLSDPKPTGEHQTKYDSYRLAREKKLETQLSGSISERETLTAQVAQLKNDAANAERDVSDIQCQLIEARAAVARLTTERAAVQSELENEKAMRVEDLADQRKEWERANAAESWREQAIQDIEALPIETDADSFVDSNKTRSLISRDAVLSILS